MYRLQMEEPDAKVKVFGIEQTTVRAKKAIYQDPDDCPRSLK